MKISERYKCHKFWFGTLSKCREFWLNPLSMLKNVRIFSVNWAAPIQPRTSNSPCHNHHNKTTSLNHRMINIYYSIIVHWPGNISWLPRLLMSLLPGKHETFTHFGSMLGQRRRRWTNIEPKMGKWLVFAGYGIWYYSNSNCLLLKWAVTVVCL